MKRLLTIGLFATGMLFTSNASAQVFQEGNIGVDVYYGTPTLFQRVFKAAIETANDSIASANVDYVGTGPLGIRGEYMVSDKIGVGIDIGFNKIAVTSLRDQEIYNSTTMSNQTVIYEDKVTSSKLGIMGTVNFHLVDNEQFDLAAVIGIGYGKRNFTYESTDPNFNDENYNFGGILFPFAMKAGFEARYFFTENIGINFGLGLGQGGLAHGGLSFKF